MRSLSGFRVQRREIGYGSAGGRHSFQRRQCTGREDDRAVRRPGSAARIARCISQCLSRSAGGVDLPKLTSGEEADRLVRIGGGFEDLGGRLR